MPTLQLLASLCSIQATEWLYACCALLQRRMAKCASNEDEYIAVNGSTAPEDGGGDLGKKRRALRERIRRGAAMKPTVLRAEVSTRRVVNGVHAVLVVGVVAAAAVAAVSVRRLDDCGGDGGESGRRAMGEGERGGGTKLAKVGIIVSAAAVVGDAAAAAAVAAAAWVGKAR